MLLTFKQLSAFGLCALPEKFYCIPTSS